MVMLILEVCYKVNAYTEIHKFFPQIQSKKWDSLLTVPMDFFGEMFNTCNLNLIVLWNLQ